MCIEENTSQAANVGAKRVRYSGLQKIVGQGKALFDKGSLREK